MKSKKYEIDFHLQNKIVNGFFSTAFENMYSSNLQHEVPLW